MGMGASEKYPTAMALVMARAMKRIAVKYADLALARRANSLEKEALSALKKGQSALSDPRDINCWEGPPTKSEKRVIAGPSRIDGGVSRGCGQKCWWSHPRRLPEQFP
jgi:hypothetical protein